MTTLCVCGRWFVNLWIMCNRFGPKHNLSFGLHRHSSKQGPYCIWNSWISVLSYTLYLIVLKNLIISHVPVHFTLGNGHRSQWGKTEGIHTMYPYGDISRSFLKRSGLCFNEWTQFLGITWIWKLCAGHTLLLWWWFQSFFLPALDIFDYINKTNT